MCGICGIVDFSGKKIEQAGLLQMRESLTHRGPDDAGFYIGDYIGLAHRRLSIIDLSPLGRQPMSNEDGTVWVVCNGEIYNFQKLRKQLKQLGHHFRSHSDTEVIVHAYEEWGKDCVDHFIGMFAFGIWDARKKSLFLARDRLGVKPLYYTEQGGRLLFASEPQTLYQYVKVTPETIDRSALDYYLAFGFISPDRSLIKQLNKLPPAHILRYDIGGTYVRRYWDVKFRHIQNKKLPLYLEELNYRLQKAVSRRLISDVPMGCFLSGGIDSGLITAMASIFSDKPVKTFSVGFTSATVKEDEMPFARLVAQKYGTIHQELVVDINAQTVLPRILWHCGEPFADVSIIPTYMICRAAKQSITVALTGDGGDESFAGYMNVQAAYLAQKLKRLFPGKLLYLLKRFTEGRRFAFPRINTLLAYATRPALQHYNLSNWFDINARQSLYHPDWLNGRPVTDHLEMIANNLAQVKDLEEAEQLLFNDLHWRLPGDYLTKVDVASNMVALEIRSPFLDHEMVEYAAGLPIDIKLLHYRQKGLLRRLSRDYLPGELLYQPKRGFGPPLARWLREGWSSLVRSLISESLALRPGIFNAGAINTIVDEHLSGKKNHGNRLWALICFEVWWRLFIDKTMAPDDSLGENS